MKKKSKPASKSQKISQKKKPATKKAFSFLWITDPWDTLDHAGDTTMRFAREALLQGYESYWCDVRTLRWQDGKITADIRRIQTIPQDPTEANIVFGESVLSPLSEFNQVHYRVDPPVDLTYLHYLQLLRIAEQQGAKVVNPAEAIFSSNEKLEAIFFEAMPPSIVSSQQNHLNHFASTHGQAILKTLHDAQSRGISLLDWSSEASRSKARQLIENATEGYQRPVLIQKFLPKIKTEGETRVWYIDGEVLASAKKIPRSGEAIIDMDHGGSVKENALMAKDRALCQRISKWLKKMGFRLAAVDIIDGYVTDFNITSPGLIVQMERITGQNLSQKIIQKLASK